MNILFLKSSLLHNQLSKNPYNFICCFKTDTELLKVRYDAAEM